ncbi:tagaturonate reductase [Cyclobacterium xiamenense]|uniref:Tagaturonate reductase n=1 Tax=Cyclobacterium xiamenense TaxID=1297121 RepID=A0A1H6TAJ9_9BACT|nr:tagaturonate reductase [Cyclobacterium xiamenense]SEI73265.1 tagaturonate reductase [Cyclobacterium xiamenense]
MKPLHRKNIPTLPPRPLKIVQFGTGNFLRGFADWMVDLLNEKTAFNGDIQMVQVHSRKPAAGINAQDGLYHLLTRGFQKGQTIEENRLIQCVRGAINPFVDYPAFLALGNEPDLAFVFSNTTEAGIYFDEKDKDRTLTPEAFPGKLTALLYQRFSHFKGDPNKGLVHLPCELVENNGDKLKENVLRYARLWELPVAFENWLEAHNHFCNTLVDRIVPGYPVESAAQIQETLGFRDEQLVVAEPFHFWAIEGPDWLPEVFPAEKLGLKVILVKDLSPFRTRKVRILNGAHTCMVPMGYLQGKRLVKEVLDDPETGRFMESTIFDEIIPSMNLSSDLVVPFAHDVLDRFKNPFIKHKLIDISLNSIAKWKVRVLPSLLEYAITEGKLPLHLCKSFAALLVFYRGHYKGAPIPLRDREENLHYFDQLWKIKTPEDLVGSVLSRIDLWDQDLNLVPGLSELLIKEVKALLAAE